MSKLHELLAAEETVVSASEKMIAETNAKFNKHTEFFTGGVATLQRLRQSTEDTAIETAAKKKKELPTTVPETVDYAFGFVAKALELKLQKHKTNQVAEADIVLDGTVIMENAPVDFLLDMEKQLPRWRGVFEKMPTLDPSREWKTEREHVYRSDAAPRSQTETVLVPVVLYDATAQHPAQVKEASEVKTVGIFNQVDFSGAATSQQKANVLAMCDKLLIAVKEARMRANSVEVVKAETPAGAILDKILETLK